MLVLTLKLDEVICIGDSIKITVVDIRGDKVRLGIEAPIDVSVNRQEVCEAIQREKSRQRMADDDRSSHKQTDRRECD